MGKYFNKTAAAESKTQQRLFGMAYAYLNDKLKIDKLPEPLKNKIKSIVENTKAKDLKDIASTKHKNLPEEK